MSCSFLFGFYGIADNEYDVNDIVKEWKSFTREEIYSDLVENFGEYFDTLKNENRHLYNRRKKYLKTKGLQKFANFLNRNKKRKYFNYKLALGENVVKCKCCHVILTDDTRNDCYDQPVDYCKNCIPSPDYSNVNGVDQCCYDKLTKKFDTYWEFIHKNTDIYDMYKKWKH